MKDVTAKGYVVVHESDGAEGLADALEGGGFYAEEEAALDALDGFDPESGEWICVEVEVIVRRIVPHTAEDDDEDDDDDAEPARPHQGDAP